MNAQQPIHIDRAADAEEAGRREQEVHRGEAEENLHRDCRQHPRDEQGRERGEAGGQKRDRGEVVGQQHDHPEGGDGRQGAPTRMRSRRSAPPSG